MEPSLKASKEFNDNINIFATTSLFKSHVRSFRSYEKLCHSYICTLLLTLSSDVHPNPGPSVIQDSRSSEHSFDQETYYPCGVCLREVTWEERAVACDECATWYHIDCQNITSHTYEELNCSNAVWICSKCGEPNYSAHAFQSSIWGFGDILNNRYHPLSFCNNSQEEVSQDDQSKFGLPLYTSSSIKKDPENKKIVPKHKRTLKILNLNCQSIRNKPELLQNLVESTNPDIIIGTESWLNSSVFNAEVFPKGYTQSAIRRDRSDIPGYSREEDEKTVKGGGTFVLIKDDIIGVRQVHLETNCEICWLKFDLVGTKAVYVGSFYRPNEHDKQSVDELELSLSKLCNRTNSHVWLGGDFNFPGFDWNNNTIKASCNQPELTRRFLGIMEDNNLTQVVTEPTFYQNT